MSFIYSKTTFDHDVARIWQTKHNGTPSQMEELHVK